MKKETGRTEFTAAFYESIINPNRFTLSELQAIILHQAQQNEPGLMTIVKVNEDGIKKRMIDLNGAKCSPGLKVLKQSQTLIKSMMDSNSISFKFTESESLLDFEHYLFSLISN